MNKPLACLSAIALALGLAACGGGGDSGGSPSTSDASASGAGSAAGAATGDSAGSASVNAISTANAKQASRIAASVASNANSMLAVAQFAAGGVQISPRADQATVLRMAIDLVPAISRAARSARSMAAGVTETRIERCTGGGSIEIATSMVDQNAANAAPGDTMVLNSQGCTVNGLTLGGSFKVTIRTDSGDWGNGTGKVAADFDYTDFSFQSSAQSRLLVNGKMTLDGAQAGLTGFRGTGTFAGMTSDVIRGGVKTSSMTAESGTATIDSQGATAVSTFDERVTGTTGGTALSLRVASETPLHFDGTSLFPVSGVVVGEGSTGKVRLVYMRGDNVTVEVDTDGDGRAESSELTTISGLIDGQ